MLRTYFTIARNFPSDSTGVIINEAAVRDLGWIALVTVGSRAVGAALANPIKVLRSE